MFLKLMADLRALVTNFKKVTPCVQVANITTQTLFDLKCPIPSFFFFFTVKTVQNSFGNNINPIQLHMEAQEAFTIFYPKSLAGRSKIENPVILNACYSPTYSLSTAKSYPQTL